MSQLKKKLDKTSLLSQNDESNTNTELLNACLADGQWLIEVSSHFDSLREICIDHVGHFRHTTLMGVFKNVFYLNKPAITYNGKLPTLKCFFFQVQFTRRSGWFCFQKKVKSVNSLVEGRSTTILKSKSV